MKYYAVIKYSRIAVPDKIEFPSIAKAKEYAKQKEENNPSVRWTMVETDNKS